MKKMNKDLSVTSVEDAKTKVSDIIVSGDGDTFALLCKASSKEQGWMKSTKVCNVEGGCLVQVSTQQRNPDGSYAVAEALSFVPGIQLNKDAEPRRLEPIMQLNGLDSASYTSAEDSIYQRRMFLDSLIQAQNSGVNVRDMITSELEEMKSLIK
jgi:hypothetical protein